MQRTRLIVRIVVGAVLLVLIALVLRYEYLSHLRIRPSVAIPEQQFPAVIAAARNGDGAAAARLSRHYLEKQDYRTSWVWMERAKRFGYPGADSDLTEMRKFLPPDATKEVPEESQ
jgi:hypothetical protein